MLTIGYRLRGQACSGLSTPLPFSSLSRMERMRVAAGGMAGMERSPAVGVPVAVLLIR
jgi:hypothetical protein